MGDFNANNTTKKRHIQTFINNSNFEIEPTGPTFIMQNNPNSTLDIIMCTSNIKHNIEKLDLIPGLCSDHLAIQILLNLQKPPETNTETYEINYKSAIWRV